MIGNFFGMASMYTMIFINVLNSDVGYECYFVNKYFSNI
ncbi:hypothetical protein A464_1719 [Salmonella bongori N268-08]|uniref:Uncharacterized protein n=1 Tax=Salmonella bongori N268-08 TaxID=1197719 RepID=S5MWC8_SALBN|nr:hypothetical protein A464_1719 [Salmonella bongori N268-08]